MKPFFLNRFMKKLTRERVVPTIAARVSWLTLGMTLCGSRFLAKMREEQEDPGEPLLARVEELVHQVFLDANVAGEQVGDEELRELGLPLEHGEHFASAHPDDTRRQHRAGGGRAEGLTGQAALAKEAPSLQHADDGLLPSRGDDRELDLSAPDEEHGIGRVSLGKHRLLALILAARLAVLDLGEPGLGIEGFGSATGVAEASARVPGPGRSRKAYRIHSLPLSKGRARPPRRERN